MDVWVGTTELDIIFIHRLDWHVKRDRPNDTYNNNLVIVIIIIR